MTTTALNDTSAEEDKGVDSSTVTAAANRMPKTATARDRTQATSQKNASTLATAE